MKIEKESLSTTNTDEELAEAVKDENRVLYTKDWKKLIFAPKELTTYTIKEETKVIGDWAFANCVSLKSINIPNSVTSIEDYAFYECNSLKYVNIPNSVKKIGEWAFSRCESLEFINIPNSVTSIEDYAFCECNSLKYVNIPNSVTSIGFRAFTGCYSIKSFNIEGKNFFTENGLLISSKGVLIHCFSTEPNIYIPDSVTSIESWAFYGCKSLESINIPNSVTSIRYDAFWECSKLKSINIPKGTKEKFSEILGRKYTKLLVEIDI